MSRLHMVHGARAVVACVSRPRDPARNRRRGSDAAVMRRIAARVARMDRAELQWRLCTASRTTASRISSAIRPPRWIRKNLVDRLADTPEIEPVKTALHDGDVAAAHHALSKHFCQRQSRFVVHPKQRRTIAQMIARSFP